MPAKIQPLKIQGAFLMESEAHRDERGVFYEIWRDSDVRALGGPTCRIAQVNRSRSVRGVLRGLHYQVGPNDQAKLVTVLAGCIYDVIVDLRTESPTLGQWESCILDGEKPQQLWIPAGCAHGFLVMSDYADCEYSCSKPYDPAAERTLLWRDPDLSISWPIGAGQMPILSMRDRSGLVFRKTEKVGGL
jgi:dTDP-4-dehydrorhamnose 3,5-epimerase